MEIKTRQIFIFKKYICLKFAVYGTPDGVFREVCAVHYKIQKLLVGDH